MNVGMVGVEELQWWGGARSCKLFYPKTKFRITGLVCFWTKWPVQSVNLIRSIPYIGHIVGSLDPLPWFVKIVTLRIPSLVLKSWNLGTKAKCTCTLNLKTRTVGLQTKTFGLKTTTSNINTKTSRITSIPRLLFFTKKIEVRWSAILILLYSCETNLNADWIIMCLTGVTAKLQWSIAHSHYTLSHWIWWENVQAY